MTDTRHRVCELSLFRHLDDAAKAGLAARFAKLGIERGRALVEEGDASGAMYVVLSGRFSVTRRDREHPIGEIGAGEPIGEIGFLTGSPRTATVTALRDSIVLKLDREHLDALAESDPRIWRAICADLAGRLATTTLAPPRPRRSAPRTIVLVPAGGSTLDGDLVSRLAAALAARGPTLVVDRSRPDFAALSEDALADNAMTERLNALEQGYAYVLMIADGTLTAWNRKIVHHADLVLAVGDFASDPALNETELFAARFLVPAARRLILAHDTRRTLSGTRRWLTGRQVAMHHHVARDDPEDFARVARFIGGAARGLVLAGGGALCVTHVGIYRALVESGFDFDIMGGTSGGSAMAAAFALRSPPEEIAEGVQEMFVRKGAMRRYTVPRYSLLDHTHFDRALKALYGERDIEDLWLPFYAVSTNLSRYGPHVHRSGPLWRTVRASASIPVMLPPVYTEDGEMLVDGSLVDNVPVEAMHELKSGPNVVVAFDGGQLERFDVAYDALPSRTELVRLAMTPWSRKEWPRAPGLATVLMRSLMANRHAFRERLKPDDLLLVPPIPAGVSFLDWHRQDELLDTGYRWARARLSEEPVAGR